MTALNCPECGTPMEEHEWCVVDGVPLKKCWKGFVCPKCGKVNYTAPKGRSL